MPPRPRAGIATVLSSLQHPYIYFQHFSRLIKMSVTATHPETIPASSKPHTSIPLARVIPLHLLSHSSQSASPRPLTLCHPSPFSRGRAPPWIHSIASSPPAPIHLARQTVNVSTPSREHPLCPKRPHANTCVPASPPGGMSIARSSGLVISNMFLLCYTVLGSLHLTYLIVISSRFPFTFCVLVLPCARIFKIRSSWTATHSLQGAPMYIKLSGLAAEM